jgi:hypothetical protein
MTATLLRADDHTPALRANVEGSVEERPDGRTFVGWGDAPYFTEYNRHRRQIFDGRLRSANSSYRTYEVFRRTSARFRRPQAGRVGRG